MENKAGNFDAYVLKIAPLSEFARSLLFNAAQPQLVKQGDYLLHAGHACRHVWFVENGACRSFYDTSGKEMNTAFYLESTFLTNMKSLRNNEPSLYSIQAFEDTALLRWEKDSIFQLYKQSAEIESFGRLWLEHLAISGEAHTDWLKINSPEKRYQYLLEHQPELLQRVSLTQLSSYIGISRETLSRIRRRVL